MGMTKSKEDNRTEQVIDAKNVPLGRLATQVSVWLIGKHKPSYSPNEDMGDAVVVKNVDRIVMTGRKIDQKTYYRYSGYPGHLKKIKAGAMLEKDPGELIRRAVYGMLPNNTLRKSRIKRLKFVTSEESK